MFLSVDNECCNPFNTTNAFEPLLCARHGHTQQRKHHKVFCEGQILVGDADQRKGAKEHIEDRVNSENKAIKGLGCCECA